MLPFFPAPGWPRGSVEFVSDYPIAESVQRLREATLPPGFDAESTESMMGTVEQDRVRLQHSLPWPNIRELRPRFVGSFQQRDGKVILRGQFVESTWTYFLSPFAIFFRPRLRNEILWLSTAINQVLAHSTPNSAPNTLPNPADPG